jgi:hypothetical protein
MSKLTTYFDTAHSFLEGAARLFDFGGSLNTYKYADFPKRSSSPHENRTLTRSHQTGELLVVT